ncbi:MAG: hypothetical protein EOM20_08410 [Spartobacteria bacterium]|nr:hypothetical protein [Spartobacteria bacterium]
MKKILVLLVCLICLILTMAEAQLFGYDYRILHRFEHAEHELLGPSPFSGVIRDGDTLYGATISFLYYFTNDQEAIFRIQTDGTGFTNLYTFNDFDIYGAQPMSGLLLYQNRLFCTPNLGGLYDGGTIISIATDGSDLQLLHTFGQFNGDQGRAQPDTKTKPVQNADGMHPITTLIEDNSLLYGATSGGGEYDAGVLYCIQPDGDNYRILHHFGSVPDDGEQPSMGMLVADNSRIYGTTGAGGYYDAGILYSIQKSGDDYRVLYHFDPVNGGAPIFSPIADGSTLYGTCGYGYYSYDGAIYSIQKDGTDYRNLHEFDDEEDNGSLPYCTLLSDGSHLYGTTAYGGPYYYGTIFAFNKITHDFTILHGFDGTDGMLPIGGQLQLYQGRLYGTTFATDEIYLSGGLVYSLGLGGIIPGAHHFVETTFERTTSSGARSAVEIDITGEYPVTPPRYLVTAIDPPTHGTAVYNPETGVFTYTPNRNFSGIDTFVFYAMDGSEGTVTIYVEPVAVKGDFDGDGAADPAVFWLPMGEWFIAQSASGQFRHETYGWNGTVPAAADYDGDGIMDLAVYDPSTHKWYAKFSGTIHSINGIAWGTQPDDIPVPADYDGDGIADLAVYSPSTGEWNIRRSTTMMPWILNLGVTSGTPAPADYDGDGVAEPAVYHAPSGQWTIYRKAPWPLRVVSWGWSGALPVPSDYDGDGIADIAVFAPSVGNWYIQQSSTLQTRIQNWGWAETTPVPADYDNDGMDDLAVYHQASGHWYILQSKTSNPRVVNWGWSEAIPAFH